MLVKSREQNVGSPRDLVSEAGENNGAGGTLSEKNGLGSLSSSDFPPRPKSDESLPTIYLDGSEQGKKTSEAATRSSQPLCDKSSEGKDDTKKLDAGKDAPKKLTMAEQLALFEKQALAVFPKLDTNNDGVLTRAELGAGVESDKFTDEEAKVVALLYDKQSQIAGHNKEGRFQSSGITKADITKPYTPLAKNWEKMLDVMGPHVWADYDFDKSDTDKNGVLSKEELSKALEVARADTEKYKLSGRDIKSIQYLQDNFDNMKSSAKGISKKDIEDRYLSVEETPEFQLVNSIGTYMGSKQQWKKGSDRLYANPDRPEESVNPEAVKQGILGDCAFHAYLASMAVSTPHRIQNMIHDNKDGTYTVTFPGDVDRPITVKKPTNVERELYLREKAEHGIWPLVMEKAFGEYKQQTSWWRRGNTSLEGASGGEHMWTHPTFKLLTGKSMDADLLSTASFKEVENKVVKALADGRIVTCSDTRPAVVQWMSSPTSKDGYYRGHVHSVVAYDPKGPDGGTFTIRNPWGGGSGVRGTSTLSMRKFRQNFRTIEYEPRLFE